MALRGLPAFMLCLLSVSEPLAAEVSAPPSAWLRDWSSFKVSAGQCVVLGEIQEAALAHALNHDEDLNKDE